jgi:hypothetical protein
MAARGLRHENPRCGRERFDVRAGLATAKAERVVAGGRTIEVARVWITEAGRWALERTKR